MGVDYTAFVCWGQRIKAMRATSGILDDNSALLARYRVGFAEYGSRNYGGNGGFILMADETYHAVDFDEGDLAKPLPHDRDWNQVDGVMRIQDVIHELRKLGAEIETEGEAGWLVCGHVW